MPQAGLNYPLRSEPEADIPLELALDIAGLGAFDFNLATGGLRWSARASEIYGASSAELGDWSLWFARVHPEDQPQLLALRQTIDADPALTDCESAFRFRRPDGDERWIAKRCRVFRDDEGRAAHITGVIADETARLDAEHRARRLMGELQYRLKNVMAVVRSLSKRTLETSDSLEGYAAHFDGRLGALARIQSVMARRLDRGVDVEEIIREELLQHAAYSSDQVRVAGPSVQLNGKPAEYLALVLHELAVNAIKFGALSTPKGRITASWTVQTSSPALRLEWTERGVPVLATKPARRGFGCELIEQGLPYQLGAQTSFKLAPGGLRCALTIPLDHAPA